MPCNPNDLNINIPSGPGIAIPGFGLPTSIGLPTNLFPEGFPEDILEIFDKISLLLPSGILKPNLNIKFQKDIFDGILNLLNKFFPFLMMYKFFLPVLNLIVCIIEVLCAFPRPFKMRRAVKKLFRSCLPDFLRMFPIFALIAMIMSLLYLIIRVIEYIINYIKNMIDAIRKNITQLKNALKTGNPQAILAATRKISDLLCLFQQLFIIFAIFNFILSAIKDILNISFKIPPCKSGVSADASECCTPDVCPAFILNGNYTRLTGNLQYISQVNIEAPPPFTGLFDQVQRAPSYSFFDNSQANEEKFSNIYDAFDVTNVSPKPLFFPTDKVYSATSDTRQIPYVVDIELTYDPKKYNRNNPNQDGYVRNIMFKNCVVTKAPTALLPGANGFSTAIANGVLTIAGGQGYESDGVTPLNGYNINGDFNGSTGTLENFLYLPPVSSPVAVDLGLSLYEAVSYANVTYTFKINEDVLTEQNVVILNCDREFDLERTIMFNGLFDNIGPKLSLVLDLMNNTGGATVPGGQSSGLAGDGGDNGLGNRFPDMNAALNYFQVSIAALRDNFNEDAVDAFETNSNDYLDSIRTSAQNAIGELVSIAFDANNSDFILDPQLQFTTDVIKVSVILRDSNNVNILNGLDLDTATDLATRLKAQITLGKITDFVFDGDQSFVGYISSDTDGDGVISVKFDNTFFIDFTIPEDLDILPSSKIKKLNYTFIKTSFGDNTEVRRTDADVGNV